MFVCAVGRWLIRLHDMMGLVLLWHYKLLSGAQVLNNWRVDNHALAIAVVVWLFKL